MCEICDQNQEIRILESERILNTINKKYFKIGEVDSACNVLITRRCFKDIEDILIKGELASATEIENMEKFIEDIGHEITECLMDYCLMFFSIHNPSVRPHIDGLVN
jgi:hypothetical protein